MNSMRLWMRIRSAVDDSTGSISDAQLLQQFTQGRDASALARLVERHGPMVYAVCRRILRNPEQSEDVFQTVFLQLVRRASELRAERGIGGWLFVTARRAAGHALRRGLAGRAVQSVEHEDELPPSPSAVPPDQSIEVRESVQVLWEELERLPERIREPIIACHFRERTLDEAARELGWSISSVRRRLDRGRQQLRKRLTARGVSLAVGTLAVGLAESAPRRLFIDTVDRLADPDRRGGLESAADLAGMSAPRSSNGILRPALVVALAAVVLGGWVMLGRPLPRNGPPPADVVDGAVAADDGSDEMDLSKLKLKFELTMRTEPKRAPGDVPPAAEEGPVDTAPGTVEAMYWAGDGKRLVVVTSRQIRLVDPARKSGVEVIAHGAAGIRIESPPVAVSADGSRIATVRIEGENERDRSEICLWDASTGKLIAQWKAHTGEVSALAFSPDGKLLASGGEDWRVRLWSTENRKEVADLEGHALRSRGTRASGVTVLRFSPDGSHLISAGHLPAIRAGQISLPQDGEFIIWNVGAKQNRFAFSAEQTHNVDAVWTVDGKTALFAWGDQRIAVVDPVRGAIDKHREAIAPPLFAMTDGTVLGRGSNIPFRPEHQWQRERFERWLPANGKRFPGRPVIPDETRSVVADPAGKQWALIQYDGTVRVVSRLHDQVRVLSAPKSPVQKAVWSSDGRHLALAGKDGTVRINDPETWEIRKNEEPAGKQVDPKAPADRRAELTGHWELHFIERDGERLDARLAASSMDLDLSKGSYRSRTVVPLAGGVSDDGTFRIVGVVGDRFQVDLDYVQINGLRQDDRVGRFELKAAHLWHLVDRETLRITGESGKPRPTELTAKKGDGRVVYEYRRRIDPMPPRDQAP